MHPEEPQRPQGPLPAPLRAGAIRRSRELRRHHASRWPYPETYVPGNRLEVYQDGAACYGAMLDAIGQARHTVHLETYLLESDRTGWLFARALADKAQEGLEVLFMYDGVGAMNVSGEFLAFLRDRGVQVIEYHPLWPWKPRWNLIRRNHRKILTIDGQVGFVGGMNISDHAWPREDGGEGWLDLHVRVEGPAAIALDRLFHEEWVRQGGAPPSEHHAAPATGDGVPIRVVENRSLSRRALVRGAYLDALRYAQQRIWIMNGYFVPDRKFVRALVRAAERGLDVRVIVPGRSDVRIAKWAGQYLFERLLSAGVRVFEWHDSVLHAKAAVVDGRWVTVGTYNLDHRSIRFNLEVNAMILDEGVAAELERIYLADQVRCHEITRAAWRSRSAWVRARAWFFYRFRSWL